MSKTILKAALIALAMATSAQAQGFDPAQSSRDLEIAKQLKKAPKAHRRIWTTGFNPSMSTEDKQFAAHQKRTVKAFRHVKKSRWAPKINSILESDGDNR